MILDLGISFILTSMLANFLGIEFTWSLVAISVFWVMLPDIDVLADFFTKKAIGGKKQAFHRTYTHYPILYIPVILCVYVLFGKLLFLVALVNLMWHFFHDSLTPGWGLKWFWPIKKTSYKFFGNKVDSYAYTLKPYVSWTPEELPKYMQMYGDKDWFKNIYLRFHPIFLIEIAGFLLGLIVLYLNFI